MKDLTLVVMAAGMGSRFGGPKQVTPIGPSGEFIIDYSIYDAIKAGFNKIVFIIKREHKDVFDKTITKRINKDVVIEYAYQDMKELPSGIKKTIEREKPLGTAHALYCARHLVDTPFAVISADDFYGRDAFKILADSLLNTEEYSLVVYELGKTLTDSGIVKRGVCFMEDGNLKSIVESRIEKKEGIIYGTPLDGRPVYKTNEKQPVSMLMYGLRQNIFEYIEKDIVKFFNENKDFETAEYLLPIVLDDMMKKGLKINVLSTTGTWKGVTYKEDLEELKKYIAEQINNKVYPNNLWLEMEE